MKRYGGFVPGIRAGRATEEYLAYVLNRITSAGAVYLALWPLLPLLAFNVLNPANGGQSFNNMFGGTCILIMVGVGLADCAADREPATAAQLRGVPEVTRLLIMGPPGRARAPRPSWWPSASGAGHLDRRHLPVEHRRRDRLGRQAKEYLDAGEYVPDELTNDVVRDRLAPGRRRQRIPAGRLPADPGAGRVPRRALAEHGNGLDHVIELTVDVNEVVKRLHQRAVQEAAPTTARRDPRRQEVYLEQTAPLITVYATAASSSRSTAWAPSRTSQRRVADAIDRRRRRTERFRAMIEIKSAPKLAGCGRPGWSSPRSTR